MRNLRNKLIVLSVLVLLISTYNFTDISVSADDTLVWHSSIKKGTILSWKLVEFKTNVSDFTLLGENLTLNDILQIAFEEVSSDPSEFYFADRPAFGGMFLNGKRINRYQTINIDKLLIMPLKWKLNNDAELDPLAFFEVIQEETQLRGQDVIIYTYIQDDTMFISVQEFGQEMMIKSYTNSGISSEWSMEVYGIASLKWEFYPVASNVDISGSPKSIGFDSNDDNGNVSGFAIIPLVMGFSIFIIARYAKNRDF